jgi:hypothetical protein
VRLDDVSCRHTGIYGREHLIGHFHLKTKKGKAIPVTRREGQYGCKTSRLTHFLDSRLIDGGEVVSFTRRRPLSHRKIPGVHFCWRLSQPQGHKAVGRIRSIEKFNDLIGN